MTVQIAYLPGKWQEKDGKYFMEWRRAVIMTADRPYAVGDIVAAESRTRRIPTVAGGHHEYEILHLSAPDGALPTFTLDAVETSSKSTQKGLGAQYLEKTDATAAVWTAEHVGGSGNVSLKLVLGILPLGKNMFIEGWYVTGSGRKTEFRRTAAEHRNPPKKEEPPLSETDLLLLGGRL